MTWEAQMAVSDPKQHPEFAEMWAVWTRARSGGRAVNLPLTRAIITTTMKGSSILRTANLQKAEHYARATLYFDQAMQIESAAIAAQRCGQKYANRASSTESLPAQAAR